MSGLSEQQLAEIAARAEAATDGPWCTDDWEIYQGEEYVPGVSQWIGETCRGTSAPWQDRLDATFVAAARTDIPLLLVEIERRTALWASVAKTARARKAEAKGREEYGKRLKARVAELESQLAARTFYLADVEGVDDGLSLHATVDAAKAWVEEIGGPDGDWFERDGVWEQWHTDLDTDRPTTRSAGRVLPMVVEGDGIVAEALRVRRELVGKASRLESLTEVRADEREEIRRLQREQGEVMKALGCEQHDEWDDVVHRARQLAGGSAVSS